MITCHMRPAWRSCGHSLIDSQKKVIKFQMHLAWRSGDHSSIDPLLENEQISYESRLEAIFELIFSLKILAFHMNQLGSLEAIL